MRRKDSKSVKRTRENLLAYAFLAPSFAILAVFSLYPILLALWISLFKCGFGGTLQKFIGFANYAEYIFLELGRHPIPHSGGRPASRDVPLRL